MKLTELKRIVDLLVEEGCGECEISKPRLSFFSGNINIHEPYHTFYSALLVGEDGSFVYNASIESATSPDATLPDELYEYEDNNMGQGNITNPTDLAKLVSFLKENFK